MHLASMIIWRIPTYHTYKHNMCYASSVLSYRILNLISWLGNQSLETLEPMGGGLVTDTTRTRTRLNDAGSNSIDETNSSDTNSLGTTATRTSTRTRSTGIH